MVKEPPVTSRSLLERADQLDTDRYEDNGQSHDFSDTDQENFSAAGRPQLRQIHDANVSLESNKAREDRS